MFSSAQGFLQTLFFVKTVIAKTAKFLQPLVPGLVISLSLYASTALAQESTGNSKQKDPLTTIYKNVGPDGSITFSDQPSGQSETLLIEPVPTVPALKPEQILKSKESTQDSRTDAIGYNTFNILSPADQSAFNSGSGDLSVLMEISPALASGHLIELRMDQELIDRGKELQVSIPNVDRGTHRLQARIVSSSGEILKEANSSFTMHRPSIQR